MSPDPPLEVRDRPTARANHVARFFGAALSFTSSLSGFLPPFCYPEILKFPFFTSVPPPSKWWNGTSNWDMSASIHIISKLFIQ
jgi:hypothetical protein